MTFEANSGKSRQLLSVFFGMLVLGSFPLRRLPLGTSLSTGRKKPRQPREFMYSHS